MRCAWQEYLSLLPVRMRKDVDMLGKDHLLELRLRVALPAELVLKDKSVWLSDVMKPEDLLYVINAGSKYSPWAAATSGDGYITAAGGHRIGICGDGVMEQGRIRGIRNPTALCIRVARDLPGIAKEAGRHSGSVLIIGRPGSGKTTLLRDLIRQRSEHGQGSIAVVDERGELFPAAPDGTVCFPTGKRTDVLRFCGKEQGIVNLLKAMGPSCIAVDEISSESDCQALLKAGWCGVSLLATAHATDQRELLQRSVYRPIVTTALFDTLLVMQQDKSWKEVRLAV